MAQCERTVSRHSRPIRHALASTSLGPLKYLERSLSISLSLSFSMYAPYRVSTSYLYCMCRICTIRSPPISLSADEKSGSSLWITRRPFAFFFRLAFGDGDEMRPNLLRQQKFRFYDAPMVVYPFFRCPTRCTTTVSIISRWKFLNLLMLQWNQDGPSF